MSAEPATQTIVNTNTETEIPQNNYNTPSSKLSMFSIQFCICKINDRTLKFSLGCIVQNRMHPKKEQLLTPELLKEKILVGGVCLQKHSLSEVFHPSSIMQACTSTFHVATAKLLKPLRARQSPRKCMIMKTTTFCQTLDHIIVPHMLTLACKAFFLTQWSCIMPKMPTLISCCAAFSTLMVDGFFVLLFSWFRSLWIASLSSFRLHRRKIMIYSVNGRINITKLELTCACSQLHIKSTCTITKGHQ